MFSTTNMLRWQHSVIKTVAITPVSCAAVCLYSNRKLFKQNKKCSTDQKLNSFLCEYRTHLIQK